MFSCVSLTKRKRAVSTEGWYKTKNRGGGRGVCDCKSFCASLFPVLFRRM